MAKIYVLQHHPAENLGRIADALEGAALAWQYVRIHDGQLVPADMKGAGGLVVMGGPMGVYQTERYPFLKDEMALIRNAVEQGRPVMGICLGAQIVAAALGARVEKNPRGKEIGWYPIQLEAAAKDDRLFKGIADTVTTFHWHGDHFDVPKGAVSLATSDKTPCQAFRYGTNVYALQFHIEVKRESVAMMSAAFARELEREKISSDEMIAREAEYEPAMERLSDTIFGRWAAPIQGT